MSRLITAVVIVLALTTPPASADHLGLYPDCVSSVEPAGDAVMDLGFFNAHGFGGGIIGNINLPYVSGVTPESAPFEADVVGALLNLNFIGVLGGGTTTLKPLTSPAVTSSGAQQLTGQLFTGHLKVTPKTYKCESVTRAFTIVTNSYFEITLDGLLTPTSAGSPLRADAVGRNIVATAGDNDPQ